MNHCPQLIWMPVALSVSAMASRFGAKAVRNIELVTQVAAMAVHIRKLPIRFMLGSLGCESYSGGRLRMTG